MHKKLKFIFVIFILLFVSACLLTAQDKLLELLTDEMNREMSVLKSQENPPYFMCYRVDDVRRASVSASFGNITSSDESHKRYLTSIIRVGSNKLDNTHEIRGDQLSEIFGRIPQNNMLPIEDDEDAIRQIIWNVTNDEYRLAADKFAKVKANVAVKVAKEDTSADFSTQHAKVEYYEESINPKTYKFDRKLWEDKLKRFSKILLNEKDIYKGDASVSFSVERKYFVSTEGARIVQNRYGIRLFLSATIKSDDGMELPLYLSYFAYKPENLPKDEQVITEVTEMVAKLKAMQNAPVVDPYTGPAILSGRSAGVFFHEIFGHRIEGHRQKSESEGQTFKKKVGEQVLPPQMSVIFDPSIKSHNGVDLNGYYTYDDEGMKGKKVAVIENGILKDFLMSRSPIDKFPNSNGHGRAQSGYKTVSRQSNLILTTTNPLTREQLRQKLIDECKAQGIPYGYFFEDITGGFTITGRTIPNSFNVMPTEVYRVYVDGRPDELVRGVDLVGTPLSMFSQIAEAGNDYEVFNGTCGAESGGVPVSSSTPSIFVKRIEMQKKSKSQEKPPILPRPGSIPE
ncbi:MAG: TldD/PmbA family protein [Bacteroidetes bacterium]|nr:TldD/PmbA family protein [Bacteroidota bacterium]MBU1421901.1 TldD/PmbA family protein [Bacteroidota bacterium]MBU2472155.1 TldD/PmbA family protein [Bacteroidota bacterium]MBU2635990.1 TldD/PmbA family protein [Bacteroidota bacterium]